MGHLKMMAAAQPFLSGAISKTCNVPENVTVEELMDAYIESWKLGLKAVAIYRDNSKRTQPLNTSLKGKEKVVETPRPVRRRLLDERVAVTHKFSIAGHEGYITVGMYEDGTPGEVFITMSKEGSTISGLMDSLATSVSLNLQYGVPLRVLVDKFTHMRFEPSGFTNNPDIPMAKSIIDYMFRWIAVKFLSAAEAGEYNSKTAAQLQLPVTDEKRESVPSGKFTPTTKEPTIQFANGVTENEQTTFRNQADAPSCHACGTIMVRSGSCYKCFNCGETSGCS
jgi:ribonucleoside-diphosphate reductase alpha chain